MIKANELRIGNYVYDNLKNWVIKMHSANGIVNVESKPHEYNPIEITEEIMLKCKQYVKWEHFGEDWWGGYIPFVDGNKLMIRKVNNKFIFTICTINKIRDTFCSIRKLGVKINYLHELQNLYFSFRGEELVFSSTEP